MRRKHVLDPLWLIKGTDEFDPEYYKYVLLAANRKWRDQLEKGNSSGFYEILFHSLNLNNLAVEGKILDFNMNPVWENPKLKKIRRYLRKVYQFPDEVVEIFKNSNYVLIRLLIDYLEEMLESIGEFKTYFMNKHLHNQKEIYIVSGVEGKSQHQIFRLKFDGRCKYGYSFTKITDVDLDLEVDDALYQTLVNIDDSRLHNIDPNLNVLFILAKPSHNIPNISETLAFSLIFSKGIAPGSEYQPNVLLELYDLLSNDHILPFTLSGWK
jgi:hypothetical protein